MLRTAFSLLSLLSLLSPCAALDVTSSPVEPMEPTAPHRVVQQWHSVEQEHAPLQTLKISIPGRVFISHNHDFGPYAPAQASAATVRFSGNSEELFAMFEVVATAPNTLEIRRRSGAKRGLDRAYLLTEISLAQPFQVHTVAATGAADLVIDDRVLVNDLQTPLNLAIKGSGDVFLDTRSSTLAASVVVASSSSGNLYWTSTALQTASYTIAMAGSGDLHWIAHSVDATKALLALAGSGDVCMSSASFKADTVEIATLGSGEASIAADAGRCNREKISVLGSGDVLFSSLQCADAELSVTGSGDVYLQASHSIIGSITGSGEAKYIGTRPLQISDRHDKSVFSTEQKKKYKPIAVPVSGGGGTHTKVCQARVPPLREAVAVNVSSSLRGAVGLGPMVLFALLSLCYLRSQRKSRRGAARAPRYGQYAHAAELHPLVTSSVPQLSSMLPPPQQPTQQQQQQQQSQVYV